MKQPLASLSAVLLIVGAPAAFVRGAQDSVAAPAPVAQGVAVAPAPVAQAEAPAAAVVKG